MSQNEQIKQHLEAGNSITALQALRLFNCLRLSGRIHNLKHEHCLPVCSELIEVNGKRVARYYLPKADQKTITSQKCKQ